MSEEVTIDPHSIMDFIGGLGAWSCAKYHVLAGKDQTEELSEKAEKELRATAATASTLIARGLILAKHQPELAGALVEQMNLARQGYADELLDEMLHVYKEGRNKGYLH